MLLDKGDAKAESVFHGKVVTSGINWAGQIITIVSNLSSYIGDKSFQHCVEISRLMLRKTQDNFMSADVGRSAYGAIMAGIFVWNGNTLDEEDQYNRNMKI